MKDNLDNKKTPWYVRTSDYFFKKDKQITRIMIIVAILGYILGSVISYVVLKNSPMKPYEETYDTEFKSYVNEKLENIAFEVIDENTGIKHDKLHEFVSNYSIKFAGQGIVFNYSLDKEQTISDYHLETGKKPIFSYSNSEEEFNMTIEISEDFEIISKESSLEITQTREEYELLYPRRILADAFLLCGGLIEIAILSFYLVFLSPIVVIQVNAEIWKRKHKNDFEE